jgi:hypothetical protein
VLQGTVWGKGKLAQSMEHLQRVQDKIASSRDGAVSSFSFTGSTNGVCI